MPSCQGTEVVSWLRVVQPCRSIFRGKHLAARVLRTPGEFAGMHNRSVNYFIGQAILEYLEAEEGNI